MKTFYLFEGSWFDIFDKLVGIIKPAHAQRFSIWESKEIKKRNLLIVYGAELTNEWQRDHEIRSITEAEFETNFKSRIKEHIVHGYNEFSRGLKPTSPLNNPQQC